MITTNWVFWKIEIEKKLVFHIRFYQGVKIVMRTGRNKILCGCGEKPLIWFTNESDLYEYLKS